MARIVIVAFAAVGGLGSLGTAFYLYDEPRQLFLQLGMAVTFFTIVLISDIWTLSEENRPLKVRSPWAFYIIFLLTGGFFVLAWVPMIMRSVNQLEQRQSFSVPAFIWGYCVGMGSGLLFLLAGLLELPWLVAPTFFTTWAILLGGIYLIIRLFRHVDRLSGPNSQRLGATTIVLLTVPFYLSLPVLQQRLNRVFSDLAQSVTT
tara:strand:- start:473 stop:1084 length:612 start_codon:yes stop_codon:yes gene_type:complete